MHSHAKRGNEFVCLRRMYRLGEERIQALKARINIAQGEALGNIKP